MSRFIKSFLPLLTAVMLIFSGCSTAVGGANAADLMAGITPADWPEPDGSMDPAFQSSVLQFSLQMLKASAANEGNLLISPASIYFALSMTLNGADGETLSSMKSALQAGNMTEEEFNTACRDWIGSLKTKSEKTSLSVANSIWSREGYEVNKDFLQTNADYFGAAARALDFSKSGAADTINGWVKEQTKDKIEKIIDKISDDTMMYLINAVYFKSDWQTPFEAADTTEGSFKTSDGRDVLAQYMHRTGEMSFLDKDGVKGVMLPYDDGRFGFVAVMPKEGEDIRDFIGSMDESTILSLASGIKRGNIRLTLPKFEASYEDSLVNELSDMGMAAAFDPASADFSRMSGSGNKELYISDVKHKTYCRVDEKGSEAAAVTSVEMKATGMPFSENEITFDRPFVYGIVDMTTGAPLFLGIMENPAE